LSCLTGDFDASELSDGEQSQVCFLFFFKLIILIVQYVSV